MCCAACLPAWCGICLHSTVLLQAQVTLQSMLAMKHVTTFVSSLALLRARLSDTSDTLELWGKVQTVWCSLESVFLGGDLARQMPVAARWFLKVGLRLANYRL